MMACQLNFRKYLNTGDRRPMVSELLFASCFCHQQSLAERWHDVVFPVSIDIIMALSKMPFTTDTLSDGECSVSAVYLVSSFL